MNLKPIAFLVAASFAMLSRAATYPPSYHWKTVETEHFEIHFHNGEEALASRAASIAETVHDRVSSLMGWEPAERTHIILTDNYDLSNGSATFFPNNRIEVFVSAPGGDPTSALAFYDDWLTMVITHEYTHIVHLDQAYEIPAKARRFLGRNPALFPNIYSPLWMIEGIATLVESEETQAGRLKGTYLDMVLRTAAIEGKFFREAKAGGITPEWPAGGSRYFYGAKFLSWVAQHEGFDRLAEFFHRYASSLVPYRVNGVAEDVFGRGFDEMYEAWSDEAKAKYEEEHAALKREGLSERTLLTHLGYETLHPAISPDGKLLAYTHEGPYEKPTLRVIELSSGREIARRRINHGSRLSWSPDGKSIAYSQLDFKNNFALLSDLYVWRVGGRARQITSGKRLRDPGFTADGRALLAVENRAGLNRIMRVDLGSREMSVVVDPKDFTQFSEPAVSPNGTEFAVAEWNNGRVDIVTYTLAGKRERDLTADLKQSVNGSPVYSADGLTIYFSGDVSGISNIYSVSAAGSTPKRLTNVYGGAFTPATADGLTIYYSDYSSAGFDVARTTATDYRVRERVIPQSVASNESTAGSGIPIVNPSAHPRDYSPWSSLRPRWWLPLALISSEESFIGVQTSGADVLGFHQYSASVAATFGDDDELDYSFLYAYDRLYPTFTLAAIQATEQFSELQFDRDETNYYYEETAQRTFALATFPMRHFNWQTAATVGFVRSDHHQHLPFNVDSAALREGGIFEGTLQGYRAGIIFDNTQERGYAISAENGVIASLDYEELSESFGSDADRRQLTTDLRGYLRIPFSRSPLGRHVVAARAGAGFSDGDFILQRELEVGGFDTTALLGVDTTLFPIRGFSSGVLRGQNVAIGSLEYRFPLREIERGPSTAYFYRLLGAAFIDAGTAWNDDPVNLPELHRPKSDPFDDDRTAASVGAEAGLDMFVGYFIPLRIRVGLAYRAKQPPTEDGSRIQAYVGLGSSF